MLHMILHLIWVKFWVMLKGQYVSWKNTLMIDVGTWIKRDRLLFRFWAIANKTLGMVEALIQEDFHGCYTNFN